MTSHASNALQQTGTPGNSPGVFACAHAVFIVVCALTLLLSGCSWVSSKQSTTKPSPAVVQAPKAPIRADRVVVEKSRRLLHVYRQGQLLGSFPVALGQAPVGPKTCQGDNRTPEGIYAVLEHKRDSQFYRALRLSYPAPADYERARKQGCSPGGDIMIHGLENGYGWVGTAHRSADWTRGCIAVTNQEMDTLWTWVPDGAVVEIRP